MIEFVCNSATMHRLMLDLGIVFQVEEHYPYRIYNRRYGIAFYPCEERLSDGKICYVKDVFYAYKKFIPITYVMDNVCEKFNFACQRKFNLNLGSYKAHK